MSPAVALRLGRVSNLPTVWTNALAGVALAGGEPWQRATLVVILALSLFYVGGMYLNDAFDREIDARERPARPIPAGLVRAETVFVAGFAMLLAGLAAILPAARLAGAGGAGGGLAAGAALGGAIVLYDWHHKGNPLSPLLMGACRVLAYLTAGVAVAGAVPPALLAAAGVALCYLVGLTYIAKQETLGRVANLWPLLFLAAPLPYGMAALPEGGPLAAALLLALLAWIAAALWLLWRRAPGDIPRAVVGLIAGIALLDALFLAGQGQAAAALLAVLCFAATLALQRWVSGT
jgi:4-hydroxybenzoate polyprenyltransferase